MFFYEENSTLNSTEYKRYHESFMQNNHGSTLLHTFLCISFTVQCALIVSLMKVKNYIYEYVIIILPLICAHTILSNYIYELNLFTFLLLTYKFKNKINLNTISNKLKQNNILNNNIITSITYVRGLTYLITVFCILAVDFKFFPRHLAKTERYGYSLMDTGVGLFVLISGLVHKDLHSHNFVAILRSNIKFVSILCILGVFRFVSIKKLDYQEHISEYGVHWNFFFTLAICKLTSTILLHFTNRSLFLSMFMLMLHEVLLYNGLQNWVFSDNPRVSLLSANREGISSSLGYVALYLYGAHTKTILSNQSLRKLDVLSYLSLNSLLLWVYLKSFEQIIPPSRTLANLTYCLYLEAIFITVLLLLFFLDVTIYDKNEKNILFVPYILQNVNKNGLLYFLVSNILTGVINMSIRPLFVSSTYTLLILNTYMIVTIAITVFLNNVGIKL
ncbi:uncharacterized protein LOC105842722 [Bombyx mori]|uniref:Phosphatidylinositol-glycan biosynthesis class W protein n=1 Tax=Bombyx mori TaxID=7091 RepID=A0A8R2GEP1_BOMMO|nr:GPI-anchored wall transfer protein 1-like [Bombyx mori]